MSALDSFMYRDPMRVLEQKQQRDINRAARIEAICLGCIHRRVLWVGEVKHKACALKRGSPTIFCNFKEVEKA